MSVCLLLTGRQGSSLPDKSFLKISNIPCIDLILRETSGIDEIDYSFCSSDCPKILDRASDFGLKRSIDLQLLLAIMNNILM